ncbi:hypothetical protein [Clostridium mediterraneense]|uniref:hypothetical protein n=1 Tax=Clostridium mediterraneense TaxID=1805472 RepID=UPI000834521C|nr:hypothetical protein [Clostridium mediterraneense]
MNENNLKLAQEDIDAALKTIESLEESLQSGSLSKDDLKNKFVSLTEKVHELEEVLKQEGIL